MLRSFQRLLGFLPRRRRAERRSQPAPNASGLAPSRATFSWARPILRGDQRSRDRRLHYRRCGDTTVEIDQTSRSSGMNGSSRTRSKSLSRRPLILPHDVMQMRTDEQIVFYRRQSAAALRAGNLFPSKGDDRTRRREPLQSEKVDDVFCGLFPKKLRGFSTALFVWRVQPLRFAAG
jgi:hypothetical protein